MRKACSVDSKTSDPQEKYSLTDRICICFAMWEIHEGLVGRHMKGILCLLFLIALCDLPC